MAITVPKDGDAISASVFGIPVANQLNALTGTPWIAMTLESGFIPMPAFQPPQYRKIGNTVYIRGIVQRSGAAVVSMQWVTIAILPVGYRPAINTMSASVVGYATVGMARLDIQADGKINATCGIDMPTNSHLSFESTSWEAA